MSVIDNNNSFGVFKEVQDYGNSNQELLTSLTEKLDSHITHMKEFCSSVRIALQVKVRTCYNKTPVIVLLHTCASLALI